MRDEESNTAAVLRTVTLPRFAVAALAARREVPSFGEHPAVMFTSTAGTWRDPNNSGRDWRRVREQLGLSEVTTHSFRKSVATLIDDRGASALINWARAPVDDADMYMARGKVHTQVADALDNALTGHKRDTGAAARHKNSL